ncbi:MAG TPA: D-alanyl-D-alanine carboxypeptidase family protein [Chlamydiales bacterium]|nr:D-alanyl-D-alanine carboxypeptidase family protein [Chlamydiales bacterium]
MKYLFFLWTFSLFSQLQVDVSARSAILMNANTGAILYEKNAHSRQYPASITKIATALYALEEKQPDLDKIVNISSEVVRLKPAKGKENVPSHWNEIDGTSMKLMKGEMLPFDSLFYGMMRISGNDAANAIAENLSPSIPHFVDELNQYLARIGCRNTNFCNPHGLHHEDHYTTAYDMCLITQKALQNQKFRHIVSNDFYQKPATNKQAKAELQQKNALVREGKYFYPKALGVKTGYHSSAKYTLVGAAEHHGRELIAVILGCETRDDRYKDAIRLFDAAFAEVEEARVFFKNGQTFHHIAEGAKTPLVAVLQSDLSLTYFPSEEPQCKAFVHWDKTALPIRKGQKVGSVRITDIAGNVLQKGELVAKDEVKPTFSHIVKNLFK